MLLPWKRLIPPGVLRPLCCTVITITTGTKTLNARVGLTQFRTVVGDMGRTGHLLDGSGRNLSNSLTFWEEFGTDILKIATANIRLSGG